MNIKTNKSDIIWSYIGSFMGLFSNIMVVPFVVYYLDTDMLGLWYVFLSIGSITSLFDFGFVITFARNITYCWSGAKTLKKTGVATVESGEPDMHLMKTILYTCRHIYLIISLTVLVLMLTIGMAYIVHITKGVTNTTIIASYLIYAIGIFLNLYYNYYDSFLRGVGAIKEANQNKVYARIIQIVLMIGTLVLGFGILGMAISFLFFGTLFRYLASKKFYRYEHIGDRLKEVKEPVNKQEAKDFFKIIWYNSWREGVISISHYCSTQASVLICSMFFTLRETGIYSLGVQIATAVTTLASVIYGTLQPMLQSYYVKGNIENVRRSMSLIVVTYILSFIAGALGATLIGVPVLRWIKPESIIEIPILLGIFANNFILKFRDCYTSYFSSTNRLIYMPAFVTSAVVCVILSVILLKFTHLGIWGLIIAQIASQAMFNMWYWPVKCHKELHLSAKSTVQYAFQIYRQKLLKK